MASATTVGGANGRLPAGRALWARQESVVARHRAWNAGGNLIWELICDLPWVLRVDLDGRPCYESISDNEFRNKPYVAQVPNQCFFFGRHGARSGCSQSARCRTQLWCSTAAAPGQPHSIDPLMAKAAGLGTFEAPLRGKSIILETHLRREFWPRSRTIAEMTSSAVPEMNRFDIQDRDQSFVCGCASGKSSYTSLRYRSELDWFSTLHLGLITGAGP